MLNDEYQRSRTRAVARLAALVLGAGALVGTVAAPAAAAPDAPKTTQGACGYTSTPDDPAVRKVPLPRDPQRTPDQGVVKVELTTGQGRIGLLLDRSMAPCTVESFLHLVRHNFYDDTFCHRLTVHPRLNVLQCGDPSGTGEGGPGYRYKDELPMFLPDSAQYPGRKVYGRGLIAMANAGPDTNGSQFFLNYKDSYLPPLYNAFGWVDEEGLATLDRIGAGGVDPSAEGAPIDGPPAVHADIYEAKMDCSAYPQACREGVGAP